VEGLYPRVDCLGGCLLAQLESVSIGWVEAGALNEYAAAAIAALNEYAAAAIAALNEYAAASPPVGRSGYELGILLGETAKGAPGWGAS